MSDSQNSSSPTEASISAGNQKIDEEPTQTEPFISFKNIDVKVELECLVKLLDGQIYKDEEISIEELHQYLIEDAGSWSLGENFLQFVGRILREPTISTETRVHLIRILAFAALNDDFIIILHQDRRDHILMNFLQEIDKLTPEEQQAWAYFVCNLFENPGPSEWLLYISEWEHNQQTLSNIRITTKLTVHCLLSACPTLQDIGTALLFNIGIKDIKTVVFDDVAIEMAMAILQFFQKNPSEEHLYRTLRALLRFTNVSPDIPAVIQMVGPHPKKFANTSQRVDDLIKDLSKKIGQ